MTRVWTRLAATVIDPTGFVMTVLLLFAVATLIGIAGQTFPAWLPRRSWLDQLRWPRWRWPWRRRRAVDAGADASATRASDGDDDQLPDRPSAVFRSNADALAAQGRYAEAVRERLRAIVRELVETGVIAHHPAWTVTELSRAAARVRPPMQPPLDGANRIFSDIWYGQRPADAEHDEWMRTHATEVHAMLADRTAAR